jgi:hypothetical protein
MTGEDIQFIRNRIVICTFLTLYEGGKLTIPFYLYFPLLKIYNNNQRGNAASIRGTFPDSTLLSEIFAL